MSPCLSFDNQANSAIGNPVFFGGAGICASGIAQMHFSNSQYINFPENRHSMRFPFSALFGMGISTRSFPWRKTFWIKMCTVSLSRCHSAFDLSVKHILLIGAIKKMVRITAWWIITAMAGKIVRPFTMFKIESQSRSAVTSSGETKNSVAVFGSRSCPFPASALRPLIRFATDACPKSQNFMVSKFRWCRIRSSHIVKSILSDGSGLRLRISVPQAAL